MTLWVHHLAKIAVQREAACSYELLKKTMVFLSLANWS